jgi:hypothetical protein
VASQERHASKKVMTWPLSSEAPRATMISPDCGSSASRGAKGGAVHHVADPRLTDEQVERAIEQMHAKAGNKELAWMFENCFPNTLDTTVDFTMVDGRPDTYVITGDIDAMWLRDSSAQVYPYLQLMKDDQPLQQLIAGVIHSEEK